MVLGLTMVGLYVRPPGLRDWQVALGGALLAWLVGPLSFRGGTAEILSSWNIEAFFLGLMLLGAGAESAGLYQQAAAFLNRATTIRGFVTRTFVSGSVTTAILSNDATPLVLTPAVFAATPAGSAAAVQGAYATTFAADGASALLPVSNPVNILVIDRLNLGFGWYAHYVLPAALAATLTMGFVLVRRATQGTVAPATARTNDGEPMGRRARMALWIISALALVYVVAALTGIQLGLVTLGGGLTLVAALSLLDGGPAPDVTRHVAPGVLVFVAALLLLVASVREAGVLSAPADLFAGLSSQPTLVGVIVAALLATALSNMVNNWPAALLLVSAIEEGGGSSPAVIAGMLIGCTVGANLTMLGSLSTVFWASVATRHGVAFAPGTYLRMAALPTLAALIAACLAAAITQGI